MPNITKKAEEAKSSTRSARLKYLEIPPKTITTDIP